MMLRAGPAAPPVLPTGGGISGSMPMPMGRPTITPNMQLPSRGPLQTPAPMMGAPSPGGFGSLGATTGFTGGRMPGSY